MVIIVIAVAAAAICIGLGVVGCVRRKQEAAENLRANRKKRAVASTVNPTCAVTGVAPPSRKSIALHTGGHVGCLEVAGENAAYAEIGGAEHHMTHPMTHPYATYAEVGGADAELLAGCAAPPAPGTVMQGAGPAGTQLVYAVNPLVGAPRGRYDGLDPARTADGQNAYAMPLAADDGSTTTSEPAAGTTLRATASKRGGPPPAGACAMPLGGSGV